MKNTKPILAVLLTITMIFSITSVAYAIDGNTSLSDLWNRDILPLGAECMYEDFPVQIDKVMRQNMEMDLSFKFLKRIGEDDTVSITIKDTADDSIVISKQLSSDDIILYFGNVPNNRTYEVDIDSEISNTVESHVGYIATEFTEADFPVNMTLGDTIVANNHGESFDEIMIRKVGYQHVCNHADTEACTEECATDDGITIVDTEDLNTFYSSLDEDNYFELQADFVVAGTTQRCQAFISTYENGDSMGLFTRGCSPHLDNGSGR